MLGIFILVFEILMIILYGIFIRTDSVTTSSLSSLDTGLFFIAGTHPDTQPTLSCPFVIATWTGLCSQTISS